MGDRSSPISPTAPARDWTSGPAKWFAVGVLATLTTLALGWSLLQAPHPLAPALASVTDSRVAASPPSLAHTGTPVDSRASVTPTDSLTTPPPSPARTTSERRPAKAPLTRTININAAPAAELELLPGIGPALAQRIIDERTQRGGFGSVEDLDRVRGIGPKLLAKLRPHVSVE